MQIFKLIKYKCSSENFAKKCVFSERMISKMTARAAVLIKPAMATNKDLCLLKKVEHYKMYNKCNNNDRNMRQ